MGFNDIFNKTNDQNKLDFLNAIIRQNKKLQEEFVHFTTQGTKSGEPFSIGHFLQTIKRVRDQYLEHFNSVDLENPDWDNYHMPRSGYIKEWEQYQQASEQEFERVFDAFKSEALDKIIQQKPDELIAMLTGLYEAARDAEIVDDVCSFDDVNEYLLDEHRYTMEEIAAKINLSAIAEGTILHATGLFFKYCDTEYHGDNHLPNHFEHLLMALAEKTGQPGALLTIITNSKVPGEAVPELILMLNSREGNTGEWLQHARRFYSANNEVAKQLLQHDFEKDKDSFLKTARELFSKDKTYWAGFLQDYITAGLDKDLFISVYYQLTLTDHELKFYKKIREYIDQEKFRQLLLELEWDKPFLVEILELEKRYDLIKQIVGQNPDSWQYTQLIGPILTVYPEFCFQQIKTKTIRTIENKRGRGIYKHVAELLQTAQGIPGFDDDVRALALQLYNHKPNLPALKDELRKVGVV